MIMKKYLIKHLCLALTGLALVGSAGLASAQDWKFSYDADIGGDQGWVQWWTDSGVSVTSFSWNGTHDAANNPSSGSLEIDSSWPSGGNYYPIWVGWPNATNSSSSDWNTSVTVQLNNYTNVSFDLLVDPDSQTLTTNGN